MPKPQYRIATLPGDGIGPEVVSSIVTVLQYLATLHSLTLTFEEHDFSAATYARTNRLITPQDMDAIDRSSDAILLGAMGDPSIRLPDGREIAPQLDLRDHFGLFASLRHTQLFPGVPTRITIDAKTGSEIDILVIRETTEGMFAGRGDTFDPKLEDVQRSDRMTITRATCEKLFDLSFRQARLRKEKRERGIRKGEKRAKVTLLHKSNVLRSNGLLVKVFYEIAKEFDDVDANDFYIDAGAMFFVTKPEEYDVVVTENLMGDIVSEVAAGIVGGLGVAPSGDVSATHGVFQPCHGSAPDIAGEGVANPVATWLSGAMMLDWLGLQHDDERLVAAAEALRSAISGVLAKGPKTRDIGGQASTKEVQEALIEELGKTR